MKTIKTLKQAFKATGGCGQVNVQQLINGSMYLEKSGWTKVKVTDELLEEVAEIVSQELGGRNVTKERIKYVISNFKPQHWGLERFLLEWYKQWKEPKIRYCAGQDYAWEMKNIRDYLRKL